MKMWCKKHGTIYQDKCYECEKEEMDKPIDWEEIRKVIVKGEIKE